MTTPIALLQTLAHRIGLCPQDTIMSDQELLDLFEGFIDRLPRSPTDVQSVLSGLIDGVIWDEVVGRIVAGLRANPAFRDEFLRLVRG